MNTTIHPFVSPNRNRNAARPATDTFRLPHYECEEMPETLKLVVYLPGVLAAGVDIEARGADLTITARKSHIVRVNWTSAHLEAAQLDYRLKLRLGYGFDFPAMAAEITNGVLTVTLPKRAVETIRLERVA